MKSIKELYRIGRGPSSSHTMGPAFAAALIRKEHPEADAFHVVLYGSLAKTGRGHRTDKAIELALEPIPVTVDFDTVTADLPHPNTMDLIALRNGTETGRVRAVSVGGGAVRFIGRPDADTLEIYPEKSFTEISELCKSANMRLSDYVVKREGDGILDYLYTVWETMKSAVDAGLLHRRTNRHGRQADLLAG